MTPKLARLEELAKLADEENSPWYTSEEEALERLTLPCDREFIAAASPDVILELINKLKVAREALEYIAKTSEEHGPRDTVDIMSDLANQRLFDIDKARKALEEIDQ